MAVMEAEDDGRVLLHVVQGVKLKVSGGKEQACLILAMATTYS